MHPDVLGDVDDITRAAAEARMRELNEAWRLVNDPAGAAAAAAPRSFVSDDDGGVLEDDIDLADEPLGPAPSGPARLVTAAGPILFVLAGLTIFFGLLFTAPVMIAIGFVTGAVGVASFLMAPLLVMSSARNNR